MKYLHLLIITLLLNSALTKAQNFYDINTIQKIEIWFTQSNWDYMLDTSKAGKDGFVISKWVKVNGVQFDSAGVKYKGGSSYNAVNVKNPFHIELNTIKNQDYLGYKDLKLSNQFKDPSVIREALGYNILNKYMASPVANFCQVYVNGVHIGLYTNVEAITKTFVNSRFYSKDNGFFFMDNFNCGLSYLGPDSASYTAYTIKSTTGWKSLINLCDTLNNKPSSIETILDVDRALWMMAFDNVLVNLDSYIGGPMHNYYIYQSNNGRFNPIVWDLNEVFGCFNNAGGGPPLSLSQEQTMSALIHNTDPNWPLIKNLLAVPMYKRMYIAHMRTILNENFVNGSYTTTAQSMQTVIDTAVQSDLNKFYSYAQFLSNITTNVTSGPQTLPGLTVLMGPRITYLNSTAEFTAVPPAITSASAATTPSLNSAVTITANVTNANLNAVYLGYRFAKTDMFKRVAMYDDGLHNDGSPGDNVFGATFTITAAQTHYYVYAENNTAGMFEPQRAEYEYYTLYAVQTASVGQVKINEFLADNVTDAVNESSVHEDWIEFYNTTSIPLELSGLYLTDDYTVPAKFVIPSNTIIQPNNYLIMWADGNTSTSSYVHCNFKLSSSGEKIMLSNSVGAVLDSISFGPQITDKSAARCPDGVGSFSVGVNTTFKLTNCTVGIHELNSKVTELKVYPNPADDYVFIKRDSEKKQTVEVFNTLGESIYKTSFTGNISVNTKNWEPGVYFIRSGGITEKFIISR